MTYNSLAFKTSCYTELLHQIQVPVTLVYGQDGSHKSLRRMQAIMPDAAAAGTFLPKIVTIM